MAKRKSIPKSPMVRAAMDGPAAVLIQIFNFRPGIEVEAGVYGHGSFRVLTDADGYAQVMISGNGYNIKEQEGYPLTAYAFPAPNTLDGVMTAEVA